MMIEDNNVEILKAFAESTGRDIVCNVKQYPMSLYRQIPRYKSEIFITNGSENSSFFVFFSDPYTKIGEHTAYCGAFIPVSFPLNMRVNIKLRTIIDKVCFKKSKKTYETHNKKFNSQLLIDGKNTERFIPYLKKDEFQHEVLDSLNEDGFLQVAINEVIPDFIPNFEDKSWFSIIDTNGWFTEKEKINRMFNHIENLKKIIEG